MTEIEQSYVIRFLHAKKFGYNQLTAELPSVSGEQAYIKKAVEYWTHHAKLGRSEMKDQARRSRLPLDDFKARIMARPSNEPFSSVRSTAQALGLALATVHRHLTISLDMQPRHFR
jgi:hypothetical protein